MSIYEISAVLRELNIMMEILLVQDSIDLNDRDLQASYAEWESSRMWLVDLGWNEPYCLN